MLNTYAIYMDLPLNVKGYILKMFDDGEDYATVVINSRYNMEQNLETARHEIEHYENDDFAKADFITIDEVEWERHR